MRPQAQPENSGFLMKKLQTLLIGVTLASVVAAQEIPQKALDQARAELQRAVQDGQVAGAMHLVVRDGKVLYSEVAGLSDSEDKTPLKLDSILRIYSMSKPIITVAAMTLYEQGRFNLDDPVARFIPAFSNATVIQKDGDTIQRVAPKRQVSIRDVLRHSAACRTTLRHAAQRFSQTA